MRKLTDSLSLVWLTKAALSGYGDFCYGGRWNLRGTVVFYTAESCSQAIMEVLVHLTPQDLPADMYLLTLEVSDDASQTELTMVDMPSDWRRTGLPQLTALLNHTCLEAGAMRASSLVSQEHNLLPNPAHLQFAQVKRAAEPELFFSYERLKKQAGGAPLTEARRPPASFVAGPAGFAIER